MRKQTKQWTMRDGKKIRVCDMGNSHLVNTMLMLERNARHNLYVELTAAYQCLNMFSGEMAQYSCESDIAYMEEHDPWEEFLPDIYDNMLKDCERRNINPKTYKEVTNEWNYTKLHALLTKSTQRTANH